MTDAVSGEGGAYVPCFELPANLPADPAGAIVGSGVGFVARDQLAASLPPDPTGAIVGSGVGFVAKPCCEVFDTFTRTVGSGWGTSDSGHVYDNLRVTYVDGSRGVISDGIVGGVSSGSGQEAVFFSGTPLSFAFDFVWVLDSNPDYHEVDLQFSINPNIFVVEFYPLLGEIDIGWTNGGPSSGAELTGYDLTQDHRIELTMSEDHLTMDCRIWLVTDPRPSSPTSSVPNNAGTEGVPLEYVRWVHSIVFGGDQETPDLVYIDNLCIV